jgi:hypothetical protein
VFRFLLFFSMTRDDRVLAQQTMLILQGLFGPEGVLGSGMVAQSKRESLLYICHAGHDRVSARSIKQFSSDNSRSNWGLESEVVACAIGGEGVGGGTPHHI